MRSSGRRMAVVVVGVVALVAGALALAGCGAGRAPQSPQSPESPESPESPAPPAAPEGAAPVAGEDPPAAVARAFFTALLAGDRAAAEALVAYPLVWDARCRVFAGPAELHARLDQERTPPPGARVAAVRAPADGDGLDERAARSIRQLQQPVGGCADPALDALLTRGAAGEQVIRIVTLVVGDEQVPTVVRLTRGPSGWRVTGIDN